MTTLPGRLRRVRRAPVAALVAAATTVALTANVVPSAHADPPDPDSPAAQLATAASLPSTSGFSTKLAGATPLGSLADAVPGLADFDGRGHVLPTPAQKQAAAKLGASDIRWNQFGTPTSILPRDGVLARATSKDPVKAARAYLVAHHAAFGLTAAAMQELDLVNDQKLTFGAGDAVLFRQHFGTLSPALDSMVTVAVGHGDIAYVSSSLTKTPTHVTVARPTIGPATGWLKAAATIGFHLSDAAIAGTKLSYKNGWTYLNIPGLAQQQEARLRSLAMADGSVRPVVETNVIDVSGGSSEAYTFMVDAVTGAILHRQNQVDNELGSQPYSGSFTATTCGPMHPFTLTDGDTKTITAVGAAVNSANDIVVKIFGPDGSLLVSEDSGTSPEAAVYSAASIPAGKYAAQVCPLKDPTTPILPPYNYSLNVGYTNTSSSTGSATGASTANPIWRFFTANPTLDSPTQTPTNSVIGCWLVRDGDKRCTAPDGEFDNIQAPAPWDATTDGTSSMTTTGNNAVTHEAWLNPLAPGGTEQAPVSATREYTTKFTDVWNNTKCDPTNLVPGGNDIDFSIGNLFVIHNEMHDWSYYLGFTEANYNLQTDNLGRGGVDGDFETGNGQAGALSGGQPTFEGRDNANQIALQDGVPGITNQYLFQPIAGAFYAPCTDGELDQGIVGHEYTHAISNRMVGGPDEGLTSNQGGAMGESWSDLDAAEFQFAHNYKNGGNTFGVGLYATANKTVAIRDYAADKNPLNYSNMSFDTPGQEVHADGEIWNGTNLEIRSALVKKWNKQFPYKNKYLQLVCGQGNRSKGIRRPEQCPGNRRWIQIMFDAFLFQQGATSMLDARDAYLAADEVRFRGANHKALWDAFARRGMGKGASTPTADSADTKGSFASPTSHNTTVRFKTSAPGYLFVGDYEDRSRPVADTVSTSKLASTARFTPGTYDMLYVSPKDGAQRFTLKVHGQKRATIRIKASRNLAGSHAGAKVIGSTAGSLNPAYLIDGTEGSDYGGVTTANVDSSHPYVAVDLAGGVHTIRSINVSAMLSPAPASPTDLPLLVGKSNAAADPDPDSGSRFTALRKFAVEACVKSCTSSSAKWKRVFTSPGNAFPAVLPRPVAPNLIMRGYAIKPTRAAALRLVTLENQCTGYSGYAGELDNDPTNNTDCKTGSDRGTIVHAAEFQAFSTRLPRFRSHFGIDHPVLTVAPKAKRHHRR